VAVSESKRTRWLICLALALATLGAYCRVGGFDFINYDDPAYIAANPIINGGLTLKGIGWAFTHSYSGNWHPLTWISLMLDCQLFGLNAGATHWVNVAWHVANTVMLFLLLEGITGARWRSALVAALFALHPLHVESVAWVSERKDVLSTFFALLTFSAYARYVHELKGPNRRSRTWFILALMFFALGLMAKPMLVTLPFLLLLLDYWPLQRAENIGVRTFFAPQFGRLVAEKWAWFILVVVSCVITLHAQQQAMATLKNLPLSSRLVVAIESYCWYLGKTFWPTRLAFLYPLHIHRPALPFIAACFCLLIISTAAVLMARRRPFLLTGWFWFLGTLVPVIGIVQVGLQAAADRYSYVPSIGLFIAITWLGYEVIEPSRRKRIFAGCALSACLALLLAATVVQTGYWRNNLSLFSRSARVTVDNDTAIANLGFALYQRGRYDEAIADYKLAFQIKPAADVADFLADALKASGRTNEALAGYENAVRMEPNNALYQNNLALSLAAAGRRAEALTHYAEAARLEPLNAQYQNNFATALARSGQSDAAIEHYQTAIRDNPDFAEPYSNLGALYASRHLFEDAVRQYYEAVRLEPSNAVIHLNAGIILAKLGHTTEALSQFADAARLNPASGEASYELGHQLLLAGQYQAARDELGRAVGLKPDYAPAHFYFGLACLEVRDFAAAIKAFANAERLRPDWPEPMNAHAWLLATSSDDKVRDGAQAVRLATRAAEMTSRQQPAILNTLAAAYAEAGHTNEAVATAGQAIELAQRLGQTNMVPKFQQALQLYQAGHPFRDTNTLDK
jgi:tetratricopeptide (TPR) repeat protein